MRVVQNSCTIVCASVREINRIDDGVEAETRKSQASFQIIQSFARLAEHKTEIIRKRA